MIILTASRPGMVRYAKWEEIDFEEGIWTIPAARMKMRRDYVSPLPHQLIAMFTKLSQSTGRSRYLFPGNGEKQPVISENTINLVFAQIGNKGRLVSHGTRTYRKHAATRTWLVEGSCRKPTGSRRGRYLW